MGDGTTAGSPGTNLIQNNGTLDINLPGTSNTFSNLVTGTGRLIHDGADVLTLTASNTYTGGTTINSVNNGGLQLNTGAWFGGGECREQ